MQVTQIDYLHETGAKENQEDYLWPLPGTATQRDRVFIVCDGVGGAEHGEVASKFVAETLASALLKTPVAETGLPLINALLEKARAGLAEHAQIKGLGKELATTFALLQLVKNRAFIAWCGDSRVYHLRKHQIMFRTNDHSLVNALVRSGDLTEEDAREHPQKNLLLKAIRSDEPDPAAEGHWISDIQEGDYFLLCTDGLLENISDADLSFLLQQSEERETYLAGAFQQYCYNKTRDNYSMYLIRVNPWVPEEEKEAVRSRGIKGRIEWLLMLLLLLVAAAAFVIRQNHLTPHPKELQRVVPTAASSQDTLTP